MDWDGGPMEQVPREGRGRGIRRFAAVALLHEPPVSRRKARDGARARGSVLIPRGVDGGGLTVTNARLQLQVRMRPANSSQASPWSEST